MKGKSIFTNAEAAYISQRLCELREATRDKQKVIRADLRRRGFHINDWRRSGRGFTSVDFDERVASGDIIVVRS